MKTKIVNSDELDPARGLRAKDYMNSEDSKDITSALDIPSACWRGLMVIAQRCHDTSKEHGWWEKYDDLPAKFLPELIAAKLMLIVSEAAEALEEIRENDGGVYYTAPPDEHGHRRVVPESEWSEWKLGDLKPEGFASEIADVAIRCFDLAVWLDKKFGSGELGKVILQKMAFNERRAHKHGGKTL